MDTSLLAAALGSLIGLVLAFTGAGGGILAIPLLVFGLHLPVQQAAPAGLAAVGIASAVGAVLGLRDGIVRYRAAAMIGAAGTLAAPLGVALAQRLPNRPLMAAFAMLLAFVAWRMLRPGVPASRASARQLPCLVN
ncbi:MAG TPA: sulfite exporter TauE/SafE family protein, partial [Quisquiliibacterium sp.]|nr:sulfite exporter TauE/SafE family protein [Quisquiliibacterium sp.]